jgi:hypothetical protein
MSGGPVFFICFGRGIGSLCFAGIIAERNENFKVMLAKPVQLFEMAFL